MPLLLSGRGFRQALEAAGALALFAPLEGGAETRLLRRMRAAGYRAMITSARGLGDPEAYLFEAHGVRPPHLGHQSVGRGAAVGEVQRVMPQLGAHMPPEALAAGAAPKYVVLHAPAAMLFVPLFTAESP